jgi:DNA-binding NtrC family response regulator
VNAGPPELEKRYRRFLEGRGDAVAPLLCFVGSDRDARAGTGAWAALIVSRIFHLKGNLPLAQSYLRLAAALPKPAEREAFKLGLLVNRALILKSGGRAREASALLRAVVDRALRKGETFVAAKAAANLALCMARCGEARGASSYLGLAERCYSAAGGEEDLRRLDLIRALVDAKQGMLDEAVERIVFALRRCAEGRDARERAVGLLLLAELFLSRAALERAREALDEVASMPETLARFGPQRLGWLRLEHEFHRKSGNVDEARRFMEMAERVKRRLGIELMYDPPDHPSAHAPSVAREAVPWAAPMSRHGASEGASAETFITSDRRMAALLAEIEQAARLSLPILIEGESGTGKDLVARLIHEWSGRKREPFVAVNVAALPQDLFESMAFGHARGAFTGAVENRPGLVTAAERGTLFLDEIGELAPAIQAKLLRLIDRREYTPLGETRPRRCEARIVAATNRDLKADCASGRFRADLYHRLAPLGFRIPPLRERRSDVVCLARHFAERLHRVHGLRPLKLHESALAVLVEYAWPGNVRELESEILRAALKASGGVIRACNLSGALIMRAARCVSVPEGDLNAKLVSFERGEILEALRSCGGNRSHAARRLGLKRTTLISAMRRLDIDW